MSLSYYNPYQRYRKRSLERLAGLAVVVGVLGLSGGLGFWLGGQYAVEKMNSLQARITEKQKENDELQGSLSELRTEAHTAKMRYEQLQATFQEAIPDGSMQNIIELVHKQLEEGMDPARLEFVIRSARPPRNCTEPATRRFVIATPANSGPESQIQIAEANISITGSGESARTEKGQPEAWYDPSKSVKLVFTLKDGLEKDGVVSDLVEVKSGAMPLHHTMVSGLKEYRFTIEEGARSFARVTFDSCDYP